jgi:general secretion pathway protein E
MGLPPFLLASALRLVVAQRLVRRVCPECAQPHVVTPAEVAAWRFPAEVEPRVLIGKGCTACGFTGMRGRVALYELMPVTSKICELIMANAPAGEIRRAARESGMRTLREAGVLKVLEGLTTLDEVARVSAE